MRPAGLPGLNKVCVTGSVHWCPSEDREFVVQEQLGPEDFLRLSGHRGQTCYNIDLYIKPFYLCNDWMSHEKVKSGGGASGVGVE